MGYVNEEWARTFHKAYERLAPSFGMEVPDSVVEFQPTSVGGQLLLAVMDELVPQISEAAVRKFLERLAEVDLAMGTPRSGRIEQNVFFEMFKKAL